MIVKSATYFIWIVFVMASCKTSDKLNEKIIGEWSMTKVYEYNDDVTEKHNPDNNRWIRFNEDGTFVSDGDPFGRNTGTWKADNDNGILFLDSDMDDDDSEWRVAFKGYETIWTGIGHPRKENTKLIHKRKKD